MKQNFTLRSLLVLLCSTIVGTASYAQVSGTVFRDINSNGSRELSAPSEPGEFGVTIRAYNAVNTLLGTATTNAAGFYNFSAAQIPAGTAVRLEFIGSAGDYPSKRNANDRSNIQFVTGGAAAININYAIASKKFLSDNANPYVAGTAATNGDALVTGNGNAGDNDNLYIFPYDLSNDGGATRRVKNQYLGSVYGLAWQKESRTLLMAAYLKRHVGFGPNGIGAIYQSQISTSGIPSTPTLLVDVTTIGINIGANPRTVPLPGSSSAGSTDVGVFAEIGKRGIGCIELADNGRDLYLVNMYEKKLHRINIGNPLKSSFNAGDVTGNWIIPDPGITGTVWHPMALKMYAGKIYVGGVCARETVTAHNIADTAGLRGVVYQFDPATNLFTEVLRFPLSHRRGFTNSDYRYEYRNNYWSAWQNNGDISLGGPLRAGLIGSTTGSNATGIYYSQPLLSAIEFDVDGSMILGIRDRFGDQAGYANYFETGNVSGETYRALTTGEVLRAGRTGTLSWSIENGGSVTTGGVTTTTAGVTDNNPAQTGSFPGMTGTPWGGGFGPGGRYYYYNHNFTTTGVPAPFNSGATVTSHYTKSNGGLALLPGYNEVMTTAIDPTNRSFSNGIIKNVNLGANAGNMSARMELLRSLPNDPTNMGKAAALGDIEVLLDAQAVEIGNLIWNDLNGNGRQDANEPGIANVSIQLRSPGGDGAYNTGDDQTWTVITDANGNYYFDGSFVNDARRPSSWIGVSSTNSGILPGFEYRLEINGSQPALSGLILTFANAAGNIAIDSNGTYSGVDVHYVLNPGGSVAAGSGFENNYDIDFGFATQMALSVKKIELAATVNNSTTRLTWNTTNELNIQSHTVERSLNGSSFTSIGEISSKGNGNFTYLYNDDLSSISESKIYYRIRITDTKNKISYSQVVAVNVSNGHKTVISPNPFVSAVNLQLYSAKKQSMDVSIYNTSGQRVAQKTFLVMGGINSVSFSGLDKMAAGTYILQVNNDGVISSHKLVKR